MTEQLCPDRGVLAAFGRGELPETIFESVAAHVPECSTCQQVLAELRDSGDPLLAGLRQIHESDLAAPLPHTQPTPHTSSSSSSPVLTPPGYDLLGEVGRGGMGVVQRARDLRLNREVAVKLLREEYPADSAARDRFVVEARITGQLQHPGIPAVHELGTLPDGRPFLAMKLVKGRTLHELLRERGDPGQERGRFLAIFEQICQAVGYAHAHRVIHRDLKPGNVMVGAFGEVQVMDWGLAKVLSAEAPARKEDEGVLPETLLLVTAIETPRGADSATRTGAVMGTPAYMAPEQAGGEIRKLDARSDVFGLGAILCAILTGLPPYQGENANEIRLQAVRGEMADTLIRLDECGAEPEIVALCKRCLSFRQEDRPADGGAVAAEVACIRQASEERARRAELERAEALVREAEQRKRRRVWLGLAASLLVGLVVSTGLGLWANHARQQAESAQAAEKEARQAEAARAEGERLATLEAVSAKEQAQKRLKQIEQSNDVLTSIFTDLDIKKIKQEKEPLEAVLAKRLIKAAEQLEGEAIGDPLTVAMLQNRLGLTLLHLGYAKEAIPLFEKARIVRADKLGADHPDTLICTNNLAISYGIASQLDKALPLLEESVRLRQAKLGAEHPSTFQSMNNLAMGYKEAGQLDKALPLFAKILRLRKAKLGADHPSTLQSMNNLATAYQAAGQLDKALPLLEETLTLRKAKLETDHPDTLQSMNNLAEGYQAAGKSDKALPLHEETLRLRKAKLGADHPDTLGSMNNLAAGYWRTGQRDKAMPFLKETLRLCKAKLGVDHRETLISMNNLAIGYQNTGQLDKALPLLEEILRLFKAKLGADHPDTLRSMGNLAMAYQDAGQLDKALPLSEETLRRMKGKLGIDHPDTLTSMSNLGNGYRAAGQLDKALPLLAEALRLSKTKLGTDHPHTLLHMNNLALAYCEAKRGSEAVPVFAAYFQRQRKRIKPNDPVFAGQLANAAQKLLTCDRYQEAEPYLRECLAIREKTQPDAWNTFNAQSMLGGALLGQKKYADAEPFLLKGYQGMKQRQAKIPKVGKARLSEAATRLVQLYDAWGKPTEAANWRQELAKQKKTQSQSKN